MKIIVIHGDHSTKSYERLQVFIKEAKKRSWQVKKLRENSKLSLAEQLVSPDLFSSSNFFILDKINDISDKDLLWLKTNYSKIDGTLIICHQNTLNKSIIKKLPKNLTVEEFKLPKLIWSFLDSFYPGNAKNTLILLHEVIKNEPIEFVFSLLAKHLRDLFWVKHDSNIPGYQLWRIGKLARQASKFSSSLLSDIISDLSEIDINVKTSKDNLLDALDFLIVTKLE